MTGCDFKKHISPVIDSQQSFDLFVETSNLDIIEYYQVIDFLLKNKLWFHLTLSFKCDMETEQEIYEWILKNCQGKAALYGIDYWFQNYEDAVLFKMKWL